MSETIELKHVLAQMRATKPNGAPIPFSVAFVTADRNLKTGGEIIQLPEAIVFSGNKQPSEKPIPNAAAKRQNHRTNATVNFWLPGPQRFMKAHVDLLLSFNNKWIVW